MIHRYTVCTPITRAALEAVRLPGPRGLRAGWWVRGWRWAQVPESPHCFSTRRPSRLPRLAHCRCSNKRWSKWRFYPTARWSGSRTRLRDLSRSGSHWSDPRCTGTQGSGPRWTGPLRTGPRWSGARRSGLRRAGPPSAGLPRTG